jgi:hypothetical protein
VRLKSCAFAYCQKSGEQLQVGRHPRSWAHLIWAGTPNPGEDLGVRGRTGPHLRERGWSRTNNASSSRSGNSVGATPVLADCSTVAGMPVIIAGCCVFPFMLCSNLLFRHWRPPAALRSHGHLSPANASRQLQPERDLLRVSVLPRLDTSHQAIELYGQLRRIKFASVNRHLVAKLTLVYTAKNCPGRF